MYIYICIFGFTTQYPASQKFVTLKYTFQAKALRFQPEAENVTPNQIWLCFVGTYCTINLVLVDKVIKAVIYILQKICIDAFIYFNLLKLKVQRIKLHVLVYVFLDVKILPRHETWWMWLVLILFDICWQYCTSINYCTASLKFSFTEHYAQNIEE